MKLRLANVVVVCAFGAFASSARADETAAREASREYDAAAAAYDRGDYGAAAAGFARADDRVPNPRVLQLALAAALAGSDAPLAMSLAERADTRREGGAIGELAKRVRRKFGGEAGRLRVVCPESTKCEVSVDGKHVDTASPVWFATGSHAVSVRTDSGAKLDRDVLVSAGAIADVVVAEAKDSAPRIVVTSPPASTSPAARSNGLPPWIFWTSLGVTAIGAGVSTAFTLDTKSKHDEFVAEPSRDTADAGDAAQTRARIGWIVTGVLAATTVVLWVLTDFDGGKKRAQQLGGSSFVGHFP